MLLHGLVPILCLTKQLQPNTKRVRPILYIATSELKEKSIPSFIFHAYIYVRKSQCSKKKNYWMKQL